MYVPRLKVTMVIEMPVMLKDSATLDDEARSMQEQLGVAVGTGVTQIHLQGAVVAVNVEPMQGMSLD